MHVIENVAIGDKRVRCNVKNSACGLENLLTAIIPKEIIYPRIGSCTKYKASRKIKPRKGVNDQNDTKYARDFFYG